MASLWLPGAWALGRLGCGGLQSSKVTTDIRWTVQVRKLNRSIEKKHTQLVGVTFLISLAYPRVLSAHVGCTCRQTNHMYIELTAAHQLFDDSLQANRNICRIGGRMCGKVDLGHCNGNRGAVNARARACGLLRAVQRPGLLWPTRGLLADVRYRRPPAVAVACR